MMYRILVFILIFAASTNSSKAQFRKLEKKNHSVNKTLKEILADPDFTSADFGFYAMDLKTGQVISSYRPDKSLMPASNQKLITTATMLELYGPEFRFSTQLEFTGNLDTIHRVLRGDIIIKGGGDPCLGSKYFGPERDTIFLGFWLDAVRSLGIDSIAGAIVADADIYSDEIVPVTWSWGNMGNYYGAGPCGLSIYDNYFTIYFNTPSTAGDTAQIAEIWPDIEGLTFINRALTDSINYDNLNIYGAPYSNERLLSGELPLGKTAFGVKGSMPDPALLAAHELYKMLSKNGIQTRDGATSTRILKSRGKVLPTERTLFLEMLSPGLSEIIRETNTHSVNLFAEHMLIHCGLKQSGKNKTEQATGDVIRFWKSKGIDTRGMFLFDGSGLSRANSFTARQMTGILKYMKDSSQYFEDFYESLPVGGKTGTLKSLFKEHPLGSQIRAKSGSIGRVKAYCGYVHLVSGRDIAFSMMVNDFSGSSANATKKLEKLMLALAEFKL